SDAAPHPSRHSPALWTKCARPTITWPPCILPRFGVRCPLRAACDRSPTPRPFVCMPLKLLVLFILTVCGLAAEPRDISTELETLRVKYKLPACASAVVEKGRLTAIGASGVRR